MTGTVMVAVCERLHRVRQPEPGSLAERLLAIGRDFAERFGPRCPALRRGRLAQVIIDTSAIIAMQVAVAREAHRDFGKRSRHPAQLNFGDCCACALARRHGETLLFKGNGFLRTDMTPALP